MNLILAVVGLLSVSVTGGVQGNNLEKILLTVNRTAVPPLRVGPKTFQVVPIKANWHRALQICNAQNMRLAAINSAVEQDALSSHIISNGLAKTNLWFWLSGTDQVAEGEFVWIETGKAMTYTNWGTSQPDNASGNENCVHLFNLEANFSWNDNNCASLFYFICEQSPSNC